MGKTEMVPGYVVRTLFFEGEWLPPELKRGAADLEAIGNARTGGWGKKGVGGGKEFVGGPS